MGFFLGSKRVLTIYMKEGIFLFIHGYAGRLFPEVNVKELG